MIGGIGLCLKFSIRFVFIFLIIVTLLIGGYTSFLHKENGLIDDLLESQLKNINKDDRISIGEIEENWAWDGLSLTTNNLKYKDKNKELELTNVSLKVDLINSLKEKTFLIKEIDIDKIKLSMEKDNIVYKADSDVKKELDLNVLFDIVNQYKIDFSKIGFSVNDISLVVPDKNIKIDGLKLKKNINSKLIYSSFKDNVNSTLSYEINNDSGDMSFYLHVDSNRFYLKRIITLLGQEHWLDFIYFDKIYSVIGDLDSTLSFNYNYKTNTFKDDYQAKIKLVGNKIVLNAYDSITLTNSNGTLFYDKKGFYSDDIIANLDRKKTLLRISQENKKEDIVFEFETKANLEKLSEIANFPLEKLIEGHGSFKGYYKVNFKSPDRLVVESDFKDFDYNSSLQLKNKEGFNLDGYFDYENNKMNFDINQGDHEIKLNIINGEVYNTLIGINKKSMRKTDKGIFVTGFLEDEDLFGLIQAMEDINERFVGSETLEETTKEKDSELLVDLSLKDTRLSDQTFDNIDLIYQNKTLSLTFNEEKAEGSFYYNGNTKEIDLSLKKISIQENKATDLVKEKLVENKESIQEFDYSKFLKEDYKINIAIEDITLNNIKHINLQTSGEVKDGNLIMDEFKMTDNISSFDVVGSYFYNGELNKSSITKLEENPLISFNDIKAFRKQNFGVDEGFESEKIIIDGDLSWNGLKFKKIGKTLNGHLDLTVGKGFIDKNNVGIGFLKTLNLFNFDSWLKMFTFNFEEMEQGLHFNSVKGSVNIENNLVKIEPRIILDSDLFILEFKGEIDYVESIYNVNIEAIVPLLNKAPAIALFAGVAPEIVGVIWLVDKLAGDAINETFTRSRFNVSGTFDNPIYTKEGEGEDQVPVESDESLDTHLNDDESDGLNIKYEVKEM